MKFDGVNHTSLMNIWEMWENKHKTPHFELQI